MLLMQADELQVLVTLEDTLYVPQPGKAGRKGTWDVTDGGEIPAPDTQGEDGDCHQTRDLRWAEAQNFGQASHCAHSEWRSAQCLLSSACTEGRDGVRQ